MEDDFSFAIDVWSYDYFHLSGQEDVRSNRQLLAHPFYSRK